MSNALKHGRATSIHVSPARTADGIQLVVIDDGGGPALASQKGDLGVPGMRGRLRQDRRRAPGEGRGLIH